jgi:O-antigen/teichoic acid export membrane protein
LSAGTNFLGTVAAAKLLPPAGLGHFALVGAVYVLILVAARGIVSDPVVIAHSASETNVDEDMRSAAGVILTLGTVIACLIAVGAVFVSPGFRNGLWILAAVLPALLFQDYLRSAAIALGRPAKAVVMDGVWLLLQLVLLGVVIASGIRPTSAVAVAAWLVPGALSALAGVAVGRIAPRFTDILRWITRNAPMGFRFGLDNLLGQNGGLVLLLILASVSNPAQVAFFRVAQTALAPPTLLSSGTRFAIIPELVRARDRGIKGFNRIVRLAAVFLIGSVAVWGVFVWAVPLRVGEVAFGASWSGAHGLVLLTTISVAAGGAEQAAFCGIRACGDARGSLRTTALTANLQLALGTTGAALGGALGAAVALAIAVPIGTFVWWAQLRRSRRIYVTARGGHPAVLDVTGPLAADAR